MKFIHTALLGTLIFVAGCMTPLERVEPSIDVKVPFQVSIYQGNKTVELSRMDEDTLEDMLRYWLPRMTISPYTFPTPSARLLLKGKNKEGIDFEMIVYVGQNWFGDGIGAVTVADTQAFTLWRIINKTTANRAHVATP